MKNDSSQTVHLATIEKDICDDISKRNDNELVIDGSQIQLASILPTYLNRAEINKELLSKIFRVLLLFNILCII